MNTRIATLCCIFVAFLAAAAEDRAVRPPFPVSLHADCWLSQNAAGYSVAIDRASATHTRIVFRPKDGIALATSFVVPGVLAQFQTHRNDLLLTFENPGPTTRAYSEVDGKVRQIFECTSRFGAEAVPIWTEYGGALVCLQGEQMVGSLWLPTVAKIYVRGEKSYELAEEGPYRDLFQTLGRIYNRETHKLSNGAWNV